MSVEFWRALADVAEYAAERRRLAIWLVRDGDRRTHHHPRLEMYARIDAARRFGAPGSYEAFQARIAAAE